MTLEAPAGQHTRTRAVPYRPEIDGLRAVAVVPVVLFHAGLTAMSGGYIGVDVFFVISGYLITSIILREQSAGHFSLVRFYERRARRILPALFVVLAFSSFFSWRLMLPSELEGYGRSLAAVSGFVSNLYFWKSSGYFDAAAELKPLLHTWSLGVEEQFYLLFPIFIVLAWRFGVRLMVVALGIIALGSLAVSQAMLPDRAVAAFYLAPPRAWELLAGALLAIAANTGWSSERTPLRHRHWLGVAGIVLIIGPMLAYSETTPFPGLAAVPPVAGTVLLLAYGTPDTWVGNVLTWKPLVLIGLVSYSAYLWHQPLFAFARLASRGSPSVALLTVLTVLTFILAYGSWRWIEAPFRSPSGWNRREIFLSGGVASAVAVVFGLYLAGSGGLPTRWPAEQLALISPAKTSVNGCPSIDEWLRVCHLGETDAIPKLALVGDSHAYALASALEEELKTRGEAAVLVHTDCHPIDGIHDSREDLGRSRIEYCSTAHERLREYLAASDAAAVVIAIRWTARLYPMGDAIDAPEFDNREGGRELNYPYRRNVTIGVDGTIDDGSAPKTKAVTRFIEGIAATRPTLVLYPIPEAGWSPARLNLLALNQGNVQDISTSWTRYRERNAEAISLLDSVSDVSRLRPEEIFCNTMISDRCAIQYKDELYYADDDHLSNLGAQRVVRRILEAFADSAATHRADLPRPRPVEAG